MNPLYQSLNKSQQRAVDNLNGPLLIVAGAGSGKTRVLTSRLAAILDSGAAPESIVAITFTNKAADEMKNRVGKRGDKLFIGTFHSLGARILKKEAGLTGRKSNFTIFDDDDSTKLIKEIIKNFNLSSRQNLNYFTLKKAFSGIKSGTADFEDENKLIQRFFEEYEAALMKNNAFDFDDLIEKPVKIFQNNPEILGKYQNKFQYVLVDEFQDTNQAQYDFIKLLAQKHKNLSVVGDDQQCLIPETKIITAKGPKAIRNLTLKDKILAASGDGEICESKIFKIVKNKYSGPLIKITTVNNKIIKMTPNHLVFSKLPLLTDIYFVYLMYRKDKGFRIGITKGTRINKKNGEMQIGLIVRNNQEKADKIWILKLCQDRAEAEFYEFYYAFKYGIPTVVFDTNNRSMKLNQSHIDRLYKNIDTKSRAAKLMEENLIYFNYPHWLPQGTIRHSSRRLRVRLTLFDDRRKSLIHPWGMSRISVNTKDLRLKKEIEKLGFKTRKGKLNGWRFEITSLDYGKLEKIAAKIKSINSEIEIVRTACLTKNKRLFFQPAAHIRPKMLIAVNNKNKATEEIVKKVGIEHYDGFVYDLNVENVHNYIANNFVVHNSIYGFRGSDFKIFLNFERDWPKTEVVTLEQNYRSSGNIIKSASVLISKNKFQKPKNLWTENPEGEPIKIIERQNEDEEARWVADRISNLKSHPPAGGSNSIGILYRTNAQSRAIETALIENGIAYKIFGGLKFYERKEIKDIVAALRFAFNPKDEISLARLKTNFLKKPFLEIRENAPKMAEDLKPIELIGYVLKTADYFESLKKHYPNFEERTENINELIYFASSFNDLGEFLERISLLQSADNIREDSGDGKIKNRVGLMTIHLAKGLEFDEVFIIGCNEGILPHQMSYHNEEEIEEERRLMYVAMTRAKRNLYLSFYHIPSRFLYELPPEFVEFIGNRSFDSLDDEERYIYD